MKQKVTESGSSKKSCSKGSNSKHLLAVEEFKFRTNSTKHQSRVAETVNKNVSFIIYDKILNKVSYFM